MRASIPLHSCNNGIFHQNDFSHRSARAHTLTLTQPTNPKFYPQKMMKMHMEIVVLDIILKGFYK